ncbi:MAG: quinol monooxygenase YgiN [Desulforhopalus sp.]|jgi:quinol monooxygenase YgiN
MNKIAVVAVLKAKTGKEEALGEALAKLVSPSREDDGCISYDLHRNSDDRSVFIFYERWESRELLDQHLAQPHLTAFGEKAGDLLDGPPDVKILEILS